MTGDFGTTEWTFFPAPAVRRAERHYQTGGLAAWVEVHPRGADFGWVATAHCPNGSILLHLTIRAAGGAGLGLAVACCDVALGHKPHDVYRVEAGTPAPYVRARTGADAAAGFRVGGTKHGPPRTPAVRKVASREIRALLQLEVPPT